MTTKWRFFATEDRDRGACGATGRAWWPRLAGRVSALVDRPGARGCGVPQLERAVDDQPKSTARDLVAEPPENRPSAAGGDPSPQVHAGQGMVARREHRYIQRLRGPSRAAYGDGPAPV
jgi:hypothetical protein